MDQRDQLVIVEIMPAYLRASHEAAGGSGRWPLNGAQRYVVRRGDAEDAIEDSPGWVTIIRVARARDFREIERREDLAGV